MLTDAIVFVAGVFVGALVPAAGRWAKAKWSLITKKAGSAVTTAVENDIKKL